MPLRGPGHDGHGGDHEGFGVADCRAVVMAGPVRLRGCGGRRRGGDARAVAEGAPALLHRGAFRAAVRRSHRRCRRPPLALRSLALEVPVIFKISSDLCRRDLYFLSNTRDYLISADLKY